MIYPRCVRSESRLKRLANRYARSLALCSVWFLATFISAFSQLEESPDIPELLKEVKRNSDENWRRVIAEYPNYTYKWRKVWRGADKKGQIKETSELYELFFPMKCAGKKCRTQTVLLAKDGKPVAAEKIEKQRAKAGERLERMETDKQAERLPSNRAVALHWMRFGYYMNQPFAADPKVIVSINGQEILEKCDFFAPAREVIDGREIIVLSFRPRTGAVFSEETK